MKKTMQHQGSLLKRSDIFTFEKVSTEDRHNVAREMTEKVDRYKKELQTDSRITPDQLKLKITR